MGCTPTVNKSNHSAPEEKEPHSQDKWDHLPTKDGGIRKLYAFDTLLGSGKFGKVMLAHNAQVADGQKVAIKIMILNEIESDILTSIKRETSILRGLDHPNIVKYHETIVGSEYIYIVMEYCSGGQLFNRSPDQEGSIFSEKKAGDIMAQLLRAIAHCHANGIEHRDIKPENIMYETTEADSVVKLIDFGLSKGMEMQVKRGGGVYYPKRRLSRQGTVLGTPMYVAPEVLTGFYNDKCDIWSLGVLLYFILSGSRPFSGLDVLRMIKQHRECNFSGSEWNHISDQGKDIVAHMMECNPENRFSAEECLEHEWFKFLSMEEHEEVHLDLNVLTKLTHLKGSTEFQKDVMNCLVKDLKDDEIKNLTKQFRLIDIDANGYITWDELYKVLNESGAPIDQEKVFEIIEKLDYCGNQQINYSEFIAATLNVKTFLTEEKLWVLFKHYDIENINLITTENLYLALEHSGAEKSREEVKKMINENHPGHKGTLNFEEFKNMMQIYMFNHSPQPSPVHKLQNMNY